MGIDATHTWRFREEGGKVRLSSIERFEGLLVWMGYLLRVPKRLYRLAVEFLQTLKMASEACRS